MSAIEKFRQMDKQGLEKELNELSEQLFKLRMQHATGQLEKTHMLKQTKKDIARVKMLIHCEKGN